MAGLTTEQAKKILKENNVQENVIEHCLVVSVFAKEIAEKIKAKGHNVDIEFVETAALLHDIGRSKTHAIRHGIEGAKILKNHPKYARICECHLGGGIEEKEAKELGLPSKNYLPETLEEKIICYADKLVDGTKKITIKESLEKFKKRLGQKNPTIERIKKLDKEIKELTK